MSQDTVTVPCTASTTSIGVPAQTNLTTKTQPCTLKFDLSPDNGKYKWLQTEPYGIDVTNGGTEFSNWNRVSDTVVTVDDSNNDGTTYTYSVTCDGPNGQVSSDPSIVNRGSKGG